MKILFCTPAYDNAITGAGTVARAIAKIGEAYPEHEIHIVSEDCDAHAAGAEKIDLPRISELPVLGYYFRSRAYCRAINKLHKREAFDIVLLNDIWLGYGLGSLARSKTRIGSFIAFMHDDSTLNKMSKYSSLGRVMAFYIRRKFERSVTRWLDLILTNSNYLVQLLQNTYPNMPVRRLYYSGMDYNKIAFRPKEIDISKVVRVLFIKNDFERGGLRTLIHALRQTPSLQFSLTVVGPPPELLKFKLGSLIQSTGNVAIDVMGPVCDEREMSILYYNHDIVCVPATQEGLGLVNAEALAHGTPVVSTNAGGIPEVLGHGKYGILVNPSDPIELSKAIQKCVSNPKVTVEQTRRGRDFILDRFGRDTMLAELNHIFSEVIQGRTAGPVRS